MKLSSSNKMPWWGWLLIALGVLLLVGLIVFIVVQLTKTKPIPVPVPTVVIKSSSEPVRQKAETIVLPTAAEAYQALIPKPVASTSGSLESRREADQVLQQRLTPYQVQKIQ